MTFFELVKQLEDQGYKIAVVDNTIVVTWDGSRIIFYSWTPLFRWASEKGLINHPTG